MTSDVTADHKRSPDGSAGGDGPAPAPATSSSGVRGRDGTFVIRGHALVLEPLGLAQIGEVIDSIAAIARCTSGARIYSPEMRVHVLRVITAAVRRYVSDASLEEVEAALNLSNIVPVLQQITGTHPSFVAPEVSHGKH